MDARSEDHEIAGVKKGVFLTFLSIVLALSLPGCGDWPKEENDSYACTCECLGYGLVTGPAAQVCANDLIGATDNCKQACNATCPDGGGGRVVDAVLTAVDGCNLGKTTGLLSYQSPESTFDGLLDPKKSKITLTNLDDNDSVTIEVKGEITIRGGNCLGSTCSLEVTRASFAAVRPFSLSGKGVNGLSAYNHGVWAGEKKSDDSLQVYAPSHLAVTATVDGNYTSVVARAEQYVAGRLSLQTRIKSGTVVPTNALIINGSFVENDVHVKMHLHAWLADCRPRITVQSACMSDPDGVREFVQLDGAKGTMLANIGQKDLCNAIKTNSYTTDCPGAAPEFSCFQGSEQVSGSITYSWKAADGKELGNGSTFLNENCPNFPVTLTMRNEWGRVATQSIPTGPCAWKCGGEGTTSWVGVARAGVNSHGAGSAWCPKGGFLVGLDLDGPRNISPHDAPVVGQAMCRKASNQGWLWERWVGVERAGISSHHQGRPWCPRGSYLIALDLDGPRNLSGQDAPVVGQAMCAAPAGANANQWGSCSWVAVQRRGVNSHQPREWCSGNSYLVALDLDSSNASPYDSPVVGQAMCCTLP